MSQSCARGSTACPDGEQDPATERRAEVEPRGQRYAAASSERCQALTCRRRSGAGFLLAFVVLVLPEGFFELVLQDDDPAGGFQWGALVDHLPGAGGKAKLVAGVAAVPAGRSERGDQFRLVESA